MSAVNAITAGIEPVKNSNTLLQEAATAIRAAIAAVNMSKGESEKAFRAFAQAASMVNDSTGSRGQALANRAHNRAQLLDEIRTKLIVALEPITTMVVRGNGIIEDAESWRKDIAR